MTKMRFPDNGSGPGVVPLTDDSYPRGTDSHGLLARIAEALGQSPSALIETPDVGSAKEPTAQECIEMFDLFTGIGDPEKRQQCLRILRLVAGGA